MDAAFVVSWATPHLGREKMALDYGAEVNEYWGGLAAEGKCSQPEMFFFSRGTGQWMVKGDRDTLQSLVMAEPSQRLLAKGALLLQDFAFDLAIAGKASDDYMVTYAGVAQELGIT